MEGENLDLRVLRYFVTVASEGNVTRAADLLHLTQPTLSRQISQMERALGVSLLDREGRGIKLTRQGELLYARATELLELAEKAEREVTSSSQELAGHVAVGCGEFAAMDEFADIVAGFSVDHPQVRFDILTGTADVVRGRVEEGLVDVAVLMEPTDLSRFEYVRFPRAEEWGAGVPRGSRLESLGAVRPSDLRGTPLVVPLRATAAGVVANWYGDGYDELDLRFSSNLTTNGSLVAWHAGACLLALRGTLDRLDPTRFSVLPLDPPLTATVVMAWRRGRVLPAAADAFVRSARERLGDG